MAQEAAAGCGRGFAVHAECVGTVRAVDDLLFNSGYLRDALEQQSGRLVDEVVRTDGLRSVLVPSH